MQVSFEWVLHTTLEDFNEKLCSRNFANLLFMFGDIARGLGISSA